MTKPEEDDILKKHLLRISVQPSDASFNAFNTKLLAAQKKKKRRGIIWLFSGTGIAALILLSLFVKSPLQNIISKQKNVPLAQKSNQNNPSPLKTKEAGLKESEQNRSSKQMQKNKYLVKSSKLKTESEVASIPSSQTNAGYIPGRNLVQNNSSASLVSPVVSVHTKVIEVISGNHETNKGSILTETPDSSTATLPLFLSSVITKGLLPEHYFDSVLITLPENNTAKEIVQLRATKFKPVFYAGLSLAPVYVTNVLSVNQGSNYRTAYNSNFQKFYLNNRNQQKQTSTTIIPGIKVGAILRDRVEAGFTFGAFRLSSSEKVIFQPVDTTGIGNGNPQPNPLNFPPVGSSSQTESMNKNGISDSSVYKNRFSYLYGTIDLALRFHFRNLTILPGAGVSFNRLVKASYLLVDTAGYNYLSNDKKELNQTLTTISFKLGVCKKLTRNMDLQLNPFYLLSLQSVYDKRYFISQKFNGLGIQGALIYKFR